MKPTTTETKSADVRLRLEPELKEEVVRVLADAGLDISTAVRIFFRKVAAHGGLPFEQPSFQGEVEGMIAGASVRVPFWPSTHNVISVPCFTSAM